MVRRDCDACFSARRTSHALEKQLQPSKLLSGYHSHGGRRARSLYSFKNPVTVAMMVFASSRRPGCENSAQPEIQSLSAAPLAGLFAKKATF